MPCELRIAYDPSTKLGEGDVLGRYEHPLDAAEAMVNCGAPCTQIIRVHEDGTAEWLDEVEERPGPLSRLPPHQDGHRERCAPV